MVKSVFNVTEFTKSMLYNCIKVVRLKPDQPNQWLRAYKQSAKVICRLDRHRTSHSKRQKSHNIWALKLLSAHAFNYIVLRVNPGYF